MDRGMKKVYELEELGIIRQEPQKVDGEMQMCAAPNLERIEEWLNSRTVDGKKVTKKQGEIIDQFIYFCSMARTDNGESLEIFEKRKNDPKFIKWKNKQAQKYYFKIRQNFKSE